MSLPITLSGKDIFGNSVSIEISNLQRLGIERNNLVSIDLEPLESLENPEMVTKLVAHESYLEEIDLSFLKRCSNLSVVYLFSNKLKKIDLSPLKHCPKLIKLSLYDNCLTEIDLRPLQASKELKALWLHFNNFKSIDFSPVAQSPELKRIGLDRNIDLMNSRVPNNVVNKFEYFDEDRPQREPLESEIMEDPNYDQYASTGEYNYYPEQSPNDQRSNVMNQNNPDHKANVDNRANQMNPKHPAYHLSRGKGKK